MSMAVTGWACGATGDRIALADLVTPARAGMMPRAAAHHVEHAARVASPYRSSPHRPAGRVVTRRRSNVASGIPHLDSTASWRSQFSLMHIIFGPDNAYLRDQTQRQAFPKVRRVWE